MSEFESTTLVTLLRCGNCIEEKKNRISSFPHVIKIQERI